MAGSAKVGGADIAAAADTLGGTGGSLAGLDSRPLDPKGELAATWQKPSTTLSKGGGKQGVSGLDE
jgi:hypothetical protein